MGDPYATFSQCGMDRFMPYATARKMMEHYERSKTMDGKRDFVDLPLAVAGIRIEDSGVEYMPPEGNIPQCGRGSLMSTRTLTDTPRSSQAADQPAKRSKRYLSVPIRFRRFIRSAEGTRDSF